MSFFDRKRKELEERGIDPARLPPGQYFTDRFPVLHVGSVPDYPDLGQWDLEISGLVAAPRRLTWADVLALPATTITVDIHCVTKWSKFDTGWKGVAFDEVLATVQQDRALLDQLLQALCASLSDAYDQLNSVAFGGTVDRVVKLLRKLGSDLGRRSGDWVEIPTYLTQEEIAQMIAVRRERVSLAMNVLRDKGLVQYSRRGTLVLDPDALEGFDALAPARDPVPSPA